jgi:group I intron endonuclease
MIGIYKITSPSNKIYIGQSIDIERRKKSYALLNCNQQPKVYNSLVKYGWENHQHEIIEECSLDKLNERELYWKEYYVKQLGWDNVLFCELHDRDGGPRSEETKQKLRKPKSKEHKIKIGNANRRPKPEGFREKLQKPKSFQHVENISKGKLGKNKPMGFGNKITELKSKPIQQFTLEGELLNEFNSVKEANLFLNKSSHSIGRVCRGETKTAFGFIWKWKAK